MSLAFQVFPRHSPVSSEMEIVDARARASLVYNKYKVIKLLDRIFYILFYERALSLMVFHCDFACF